MERIVSWIKITQHTFITFFCSAITSGQSSNRSAHPHRSHRTLRDGSFGARCSRHFVPGYDHAVPPGHFAGSSHAATCPPHRANHISDRILHLRGGDSSGMRSRSSYRVTIVHHPASLSISGTFRNMRWLDPILFTNLACPHPQKGLLSSKINDTI